jgi:hypothetical protein
MATVDEPAERRVFCSGCLEVVPESRVHVIPFYNEDARGYVTTYRCDRCWLASLDETRTRLAATADEAEVASAVAFFERHGVVIHESRRGDPIVVVQRMLGALLDRLRSGALRLTIGPTA